MDDKKKPVDKKPVNQNQKGKVVDPNVKPNPQKPVNTPFQSIKM